jgi:hypothetical protein
MQVMRTGSPPTKGNGAAIALYLAVCMVVAGLFGFGFYKMFVPRQIPNPGLIAYKPPPATVIPDVVTTKFAYGAPAAARGAAEETRGEMADETTGRAAAVAEPAAPVAPEPVPQLTTRSARARSVHHAPSPRAERTVRAQSSYGNVAATFPGYAAVR